MYKRAECVKTKLFWPKFKFLLVPTMYFSSQLLNCVCVFLRFYLFFFLKLNCTTLRPNTCTVLYRGEGEGICRGGSERVRAYAERDREGTERTEERMRAYAEGDREGTKSVD